MRDRKARSRRRIPSTPMVSVTSMMDMFTIILVFLLNFLDPATDVTAGISLPTSQADAAATEGTTLTVTKTEVKVNGDRVLTLESSGSAPSLPQGVARTGRRIDPLYERLLGVQNVTFGVPSGAPPGAVPGAALPPNGVEKSASEAGLRVECDRGVPFSVLGDVLYTAGQAGFEQFRFVVISEAG